jgi:catechol 2,3-dioxygenase-like lactoylglutathione lyase family enzyme
MSATILSMNPIHHITLSVSDLKQTSDWYLKLFGDAEVFPSEGDGWQRVVLVWANGLMLSFTKHELSNPDEPFSQLRIGLDHIGISCQDQAEVVDWFNRLSELQFEHGPIEDASYGWAVTARDPDNIPLEFFCPK